MKRNIENLVSCNCNTCGRNHNVLYDTYNDEYICSSCLRKEEHELEESEEESEDNYPLDMTIDEFNKMKESF